MATQTDRINEDEGKSVGQHLESTGENTKAGEVALKSQADDLGIWATVKRFPKAVLVCNLLCIAAAADGYQINLNGAIQATLPIYVMEWSPVNIRGAMIVTYGFWNVIEMFLANLVLMPVQSTNPNNYKIPIVTQWEFLGIMLPIFLWLLETPAYYAERDMDELGKKTLKRVNGSVKDDNVETESYLECFQRTNVRRTIGAALPGCAQQLAVLSFLNTYASLFFKQSGFDNAFLITTIMCSIQLFTALCLMLLTDSFGRRNMVFVSVIICTVTLLLVGILAFVAKTAGVKAFLVIVACVWAFANSTVGSLGFAFVGEVSSQKLRARTAGVATG
ncbi:uncharacterized protein KD926_002538 [Aspergillus affinis]|uniref:uncharacterized protein n=1 Tax=Aspergillus affinis TaxID=1070780 RepID=UPI0022FF1172|nr:uncharacterized protein KD926_002538 [Aspergillus affinis]KAI9036016.1 hypothetical protein KD926_002538 [Aspergillus affinis]